MQSLQSISLPRNPTSKAYRRISLQRNKKWRHVSSYTHCIVNDAIIANSIFRNDGGPHWSDVALAVYKQDTAIHTLRCVFMCSVENDETLPLVGKVLYRNYLLPGPEKRAAIPTIDTWNLHTPEFQQILGTQLGRAVARLVLGAWPVKGPHQITRIHTWFVAGALHMRFDIMPIVQQGAPPSHPPPSPSTPSPAPRKAPVYKDVVSFKKILIAFGGFQSAKSVGLADELPIDCLATLLIIWFASFIELDVAAI